MSGFIVFFCPFFYDAVVMLLHTLLEVHENLRFANFTAFPSEAMQLPTNGSLPRSLESEALVTPSVTAAAFTGMKSVPRLDISWDLRPGQVNPIFLEIK